MRGFSPLKYHLVIISNILKQRIKRLYNLLSKAHNEYYPELTHIIPSQSALSHIDLRLFYKTDLKYIIKKISKI